MIKMCEGWNTNAMAYEWTVIACRPISLEQQVLINMRADYTCVNTGV